MKVSFVIPSFNSVTWLPHAVASCLEQTYKDTEIVVVDDGSKDRTDQYLDWLKSNEKVCILKNKENLGRSKSRNLGNQTAQGEIICVLDADDISTPNRAELTVKKFKSTTADYIYGGATVIDSIGRASHVLIADVFDKDRSIKEMQNRIVHSTAAYTHEFSDRYIYRDGEIARLGIDDWAQQIEAKMGGQRFDFLTQKLCAYRVLDSQITMKRDNEAVKKAKTEFLSSLGIKEPVQA